LIRYHEFHKFLTRIIIKTMGFLDVLKGWFGGEDKADRATETTEAKETDPSDDQISVEPIDAEDNTSENAGSADAEKSEQE